MIQKIKDLMFLPHEDDFPFSYYEYKYLVPHSQLTHVKSVLDEFIGHSDPFPEGIVDSIYYDTQNEFFLTQCLNGEAQKVKFRVRGYGEQSYLQVHQKFKTLTGVYKHKSQIFKTCLSSGSAPMWEDLNPMNDSNKFHLITHNAKIFGPLIPSIRVLYHRYRYRTFDYRITLDTNIELSSLANGLPRKKIYDQLDYHVLEIKTTQKRPILPFFGLIKLEQVSFSKFMLGITLLNSNK